MKKILKTKEERLAYIKKCVERGNKEREARRAAGEAAAALNKEREARRAAANAS